MNQFEEKRQLLSDDEQLEPTLYIRTSRSIWQHPAVFSMIFLCLISSISLNVHTLVSSHAPVSASSFAGLTYDTSLPDQRGGPWNSEDEALAEETWAQLQWGAGEVALDHEYAASKGLPVADSWIWDAKKGVYFINAYHALHCLQLMRTNYVEYRAGKPATYLEEHVMHCFNQLRQDIICHADDTPRVVSLEHTGSIGYGQPRVCRNFERLQSWALEHSACWKPINMTDFDMNEVLRYRYCPEGDAWSEARSRIKSLWGDTE